MGVYHATRSRRPQTNREPDVEPLVHDMYGRARPAGPLVAGYAPARAAPAVTPEGNLRWPS